MARRHDAKIDGGSGLSRCGTRPDAAGRTGNDAPTAVRKGVVVLWSAGAEQGGDLGAVAAGESPGVGERDYLDAPGPFPERRHLIQLAGKFLAEYFAALIQWADWAELEVQKWQSPTDPHEVDELAGRCGACSRRTSGDERLIWLGWSDTHDVL
jgi:hypothetical protein